MGASCKISAAGRGRTMQKTTYRRVRMDSAQHWRIRLTALVLGLLGFLGVAARLAKLMVVD